MKKQIMALIVGSVMSTAVFAADQVAAPKALSDSEMDVVTAGTKTSPPRPATNSSQRSNQYMQGNTVNVGINPTVGANVAILSLGGAQNVGAYNPQSGASQTSIIKR